MGTERRQRQIDQRPDQGVAVAISDRAPETADVDGRAAAPAPAIPPTSSPSWASGGAIFWPANGAAELQAWDDMTLEIVGTQYNGGSVTWTINGSSAASPFGLATGDILRGVLAGSSGDGTVALKRTA